MGAWIETSVHQLFGVVSLVAPLWVRGLKHPVRLSIRCPDSRTLMGAWIETFWMLRNCLRNTVAPLWVRGLKLHPP